MKNSVSIAIALLALTGASSSIAAMPPSLVKLSPDQMATTCAFRLMNVAYEIAGKKDLRKADQGRLALAYSFVWVSGVSADKTGDPAFDELRKTDPKTIKAEAAWCAQSGKFLYERASVENQKKHTAIGASLFEQMRVSQANRSK